uniref:Uncharacterized protein n=1 Tax=Glossina brevipalpis TaxID=37001 RepID=A0A1A9WYE7_9MUSC
MGIGIWVGQFEDGRTKSRYLNRGQIMMMQQSQQRRDDVQVIKENVLSKTERKSDCKTLYLIALFGLGNAQAKLLPIACNT